MIYNEWRGGSNPILALWHELSERGAPGVFGLILSEHSVAAIHPANVTLHSQGLNEMTVGRATTTTLEA